MLMLMLMLGRAVCVCLSLQFVVCTFWSLYLVDRELVYPKLLDNFIPQWLNHGMVSSGHQGAPAAAEETVWFCVCVLT